MNFSFFVSIAIAVGLMISPESLIILGNSMGLAGYYFLFAILLAVIIQGITGLNYGKIFSLYPGPGGEAQFIKQALGLIPAVVFPIGSRFVFAVCASTGMLVTAGFVFNEVFLYWFPNFAFAFLLLGLLLSVNFLGLKFSEKLQVVFVMMTLAGLIFLSLVGLLEMSKVTPVVKEGSPVSITKVMMLGLLLFIGFDLAGFAKTGNSTRPVNTSKAMISGIIVAGIVFCLWGFVSIHYVPMEKLADTTIPYTLAARKILGQPGRVIIGLVVIAGTCSAVNALLIGVSRMIIGMSHQKLLPGFFSGSETRASVPLILMTAGISIMMATGMAGEPNLEVYVRAGFLFWLLNYAVVHVAVLIMRRSIPERSEFSQLKSYPMITFFSLLGLIVGFAGLLWYDNERVLIVKFMIVIFALVSLLSIVWAALRQRLR
jgi:amino acid transporter